MIEENKKIIKQNQVQEVTEYDEILDTLIEDYFIEMPANFKLPAWDKIDINESHILARHSKSGRILSALEGVGMYHNVRAKYFNGNSKPFDAFLKVFKIKIKNREKLNTREEEIAEYILKNDNKDLFPYEMSDDKILSIIRKAYNDTKKTGKVQDSDTGARSLFIGKADELIIHLWINLDTLTIETAYPVYE